MRRILYIVLFLWATLTGCNYSNFAEAEVPEIPPTTDDNWAENTTINDLHTALGSLDALKIDKDLVLKAIVQSSNEQGNHSGNLIIADTQNPTPRALQISVGMQDSHLYFAPGDTIIVRLKDFTLTPSDTGIPRISYLQSPIYNESILQSLTKNLGAKTQFMPPLCDFGEIQNATMGIMITIVGVKFSHTNSIFLGTRSFSCMNNPYPFHFLHTQTTAVFSQDQLPATPQALRGIPHRKGSFILIYPNFRTDITDLRTTFFTHRSKSP